MGVPSFFKWLITRYPQTILPSQETLPTVADGVEIPVDLTEKNPNGFEVDCLYLDMNGLIHPCFHPDEGQAPRTERDLFNEIFWYIDRLVSIVRPRRLLYMAMDGTAPRAKMIQQRSRRYRGQFERSLKQWLKEHGGPNGEPLPVTDMSEKPATELSDSNVITPGTPFMLRLGIALRHYAAERAARWGTAIVVSDSGVPGEGEHKIISHIRDIKQRYGKTDLTHCVYGLDADLIMLALLTREPHFYIIRENMTTCVDRSKARRDNTPGCSRCGQVGHYADQCSLVLRRSIARAKQFCILDVSALRNYFCLEFTPSPGLLDLMRARNVKLSLDRVIDDFVIVCFICGNDFLPRVPSISIHEGSLARIVEYYKGFLEKQITEITPPVAGSPLATCPVRVPEIYIVKQGVISFSAVAKLFVSFGAEEANVFSCRAVETRKREAGFKARARREENERRIKLCESGGSGEGGIKVTDLPSPPTSPPRLSMREELEQMGRDAARHSAWCSEQPLDDKLLPIQAFLSNVECNMERSGYRERYYTKKLHLTPSNVQPDSPKRDTSEPPMNFIVETSTGGIRGTLTDLVFQYALGMQWVAFYYTRGPGFCLDEKVTECEDGKKRRRTVTKLTQEYYYPYLYAPLASDMQYVATIDDVEGITQSVDKDTPNRILRRVGFIETETSAKFQAKTQQPPKSKGEAEAGPEVSAASSWVLNTTPTITKDLVPTQPALQLFLVLPPQTLERVFPGVFTGGFFKAGTDIFPALLHIDINGCSQLHQGVDNDAIPTPELIDSLRQKVLGEGREGTQKEGQPDALLRLIENKYGRESVTFIGLFTHRRPLVVLRDDIPFDSLARILPGFASPTEPLDCACEHGGRCSIDGHVKDIVNAYEVYGKAGGIKAPEVIQDQLLVREIKSVFHVYNTPITDPRLFAKTTSEGADASKTRSEWGSNEMVRLRERQTEDAMKYTRLPPPPPSSRWGGGGGGGGGGRDQHSQYPPQHQQWDRSASTGGYGYNNQHRPQQSSEGSRSPPPTYQSRSYQGAGHGQGQGQWRGSDTRNQPYIPRQRPAEYNDQAGQPRDGMLERQRPPEHNPTPAPTEVPRASMPLRPFGGAGPGAGAGANSSGLSMFSHAGVTPQRGIPAVRGRGTGNPLASFLRK